jgi:AcrR family transcriptional regulator
VDAPVLTPAARRILDSASELFYYRGIVSVGMDLVAEHAGTTKKTIYDRFGSKDGLVVAYLEERARRWQAFVTGKLDRSRATGERRVLVVLDALEEWLAEADRGCGFVNAFAELSASSPAATRVIRAEKEWTRALYAGLARELGLRDAAALGRRLALVHEGATVELTAGGSPEAITDARAVVRSLLAPS